MTRVGHINKEQHAAEALELLNGERSTFVSFAFDSLFRGVSREETRGNLADQVKKEMRAILFNHLVRKGVVRGDIKFDYSYGYCRKIRRAPRISEVPSRYLNIEEILPNFNEIIDAIMLESVKLKLVSDIQAKQAEADGDKHN